MSLPDTIFRADQDGVADGFQAGHYLHRRRGHVALPVRVWFGQPPAIDHEGVLDRSPRWNVELAGVLLGDERCPDAMAEFEEVWPRCLAHPVDHPETAYRQARIEHARRFDANDPFGHHRGRIDLLTAPPTF